MVTQVTVNFWAHVSTAQFGHILAGFQSVHIQRQIQSESDYSQRNLFENCGLARLPRSLDDEGQGRLASVFYNEGTTLQATHPPLTRLPKRRVDV